MSGRNQFTGCLLAAPNQINFDSWVDREVGRAIERLPRDFAALTAALPGIYPQDVLRALQAFCHREPDLAAASQVLVASARDQAVVPSSPSGLLGLPPPHPLDFEWRFAPEALATLTDEIVALTPTFSRVALMGTPTLAVVPTPALEPYIVHYYGVDADSLASAELLGHLHMVKTADLLQEIPTLEPYATIVMDPPWYEDYMCRFLHFAARALVVGGHLLTAMPASGTRPDIALANREILKWAERLGFALEDQYQGAIPYETPYFERNALRAAGILNVAANWRRGDLWVLRKLRAQEIEWPGNIARPIWQEFTFGPVRLRVDCGSACESSDPRLQSIVDGDILPSVSRRDSRRKRARVWTTGNRVFACDAPLRYASMVSEWQANYPQNGSLGDAQQCARDHLFELIDRERTELAWPSRREADRTIG